MDPQFRAILFLAGRAAAGLAFYGLLRWMERRGWVNLRSGSARGVASGLGVIGAIYDPPAKHVLRVRDERPRPAAPGDPPG